MKMDKDALIKHKFWILLGVFALLWIVCLPLVIVNAGGPIDEAQKNYKAAKDAVAKYPRPKNASFLPPWEKYGDTFTKHKNEVWKLAWYGNPANENLAPGQKRWEGQGGMYHWTERRQSPRSTTFCATQTARSRRPSANGTRPMTPTGKSSRTCSRNCSRTGECRRESRRPARWAPWFFGAVMTMS